MGLWFHPDLLRLASVLLPTYLAHCWTSTGVGFVLASEAGAFTAAVAPGLVKRNMARPLIS